MVESCKVCNAESSPDSYYCRVCRESMGTDESSTSTDFRMSYPMAFDYAWALMKNFTPIPISDEEAKKLLIAHGIPHGDGSPREHGEDAPPNPLRHTYPPTSVMATSRGIPQEIVQSQAIGMGAPLGTHRSTDNIEANPTPGIKPRDMADIPNAMQGMSTAEGRRFNTEMARTNPNPPEQRQRSRQEAPYLYDEQGRYVGEGRGKTENVIATSNDTVSVVMQILKQGEEQQQQAQQQQQAFDPSQQMQQAQQQLQQRPPLFSEQIRQQIQQQKQPLEQLQQGANRISNYVRQAPITRQVVNLANRWRNRGA